MTKIRTLTDLEQEMSAEFAWRKKELHALKTLVISNAKGRNHDMCIRAAIPLLYAHWEGFVKQIGVCYLEFVSRQRVKNKDLSLSILALALGQLIHHAVATRKIQKKMDVVDFFRNKQSERCRLNWKKAIHTRSNLNSEAFEDIIASLGLDYSVFATKEKFIDQKLLHNRNQIAHGKYLLVDLTEYETIHKEVFVLMQDFYQQIEVAASSESYIINTGRQTAGRIDQHQ